MKSSIVLFLLTLLVFTLFSNSKLTSGQKCGKISDFLKSQLSEKSRITGGHSPQYMEFPWVARLEIGVKVPDGNVLKLVCGATLIDEENLLTAAHCLLMYPVKYINVFLGDNNVTIIENLEITRKAKVSKRFIDESIL